MSATLLPSLLNLLSKFTKEQLPLFMPLHPYNREDEEGQRAHEMRGMESKQRLLSLVAKQLCVHKIALSDSMPPFSTNRRTWEYCEIGKCVLSDQKLLSRSNRHHFCCSKQAKTTESATKIYQ